MNSAVQRLLPLLVALVVLSLAIGVALLQSLSLNDGQLIYALDDAYIHMAVAKNVALHGVWGVNHQEFSHSSSSPLWTLMLSATYATVGVSEIVPFVLNTLSAFLVLLAFFVILRRLRLSTWVMIVALIALVYVTPLVLLTFSGMEHLAHLLLCLVFIHTALSYLEDSTDRRSKLPWWFWLVTASLTMIRFEGIFLVTVVSLLLWLRGSPRYALASLAFGLLPVITWGIVGISNGWQFLPNSVLVKSGAGKLWADILGADVSVTDRVGALFRFLVDGPYDKLLYGKALLVTTVAGLFALVLRARKDRSYWDYGQLLLIVYLLTTIVHLIPARVGFFWRYEAYLVGLGIVALAEPLHELAGSRLFSRPTNTLGYTTWIAIVVLGIITIRPLASRGGRAFETVAPATSNIYQQQYQMGRFIAAYYDNQSFAANDIGAVSFLSNAYCVDLVGLASREIYEGLQTGGRTTTLIDEVTQKRSAVMAVVYDDWFEAWQV